MAGNTSFSTLLTTTLANYGREIFNNVSTNNALLYLLKQRGNIKVVSGGESFNHPLIYGTNTSFQMYNSLDPIATPVTNNHTRAVYPIRVAAGSIVLPTLDMAKNAGQKEKLIDYAEAKKQEAEISMSELLGDQVMSAGSDSKDFGGLQYLIETVPSSRTTDFVGDIEASTSGSSYWRNQADTTSVTAFNTSSEGLIAMNAMLNNCTFGRMGPKAIFTTKTAYGLYEIGQTANIRYMNADLADAGFQALQYASMPIMFDDNCPAGYMYFVDTESLWLQVLEQGNMQITQFQLKDDQLASSALMYLFGNLTTGSRRTNGVITGVIA
jgi:hypothetical protein